MREMASLKSATTAAGPVGRGVCTVTWPDCTSWKSAWVTSNSPWPTTRQISAMERAPSMARHSTFEEAGTSLARLGAAGSRPGTRSGTCWSEGMRSRK